MGSGSSKSDRPDGGIYSPDARAPLSPTVYTDPTSTVNTESGGFHLIEFHGQTLSSAGLLLLGAVAAAWLMVRMWRWMRDRAIKRHVRAQTPAWHTATAWGQYEPVPMPIQMQRLAIPGPPAYAPPPPYNPYIAGGQGARPGAPTRPKRPAGPSGTRSGSGSEF